MNALCLNLLNVKGEASSAALAHDIVQIYESENTKDLGPFFDFLLSEFDLDPDLLIKATKAYRDSRTPENLRALMLASEARRQDLFRRINQARNGTAMLVDFRGRLLARLQDNSDWKRIDLDLRHLLSSWFNRGFLRVSRIDWHSPATILEKIMRYEAVHKMYGWNDLRRRLADDRRCYAFFHPALPDEPLIFVEVALVQGLAGSVAGILDKEAAINPGEQQDTAIFYSINDCQIGLRGISFGDFLIKQVVAEIQKELPNINTFSTLSPIPGFREWLSREMVDDASTLLDAAGKAFLSEVDGGEWRSDEQSIAQIKPVVVSRKWWKLISGTSERVELCAGQAAWSRVASATG
ncbi:malonyl-CoA decarboxylase domain-containing protein [Profundibacter sp.]|uniref:malonyl-CoA decarboxylase domain-containing protein n=1 Tax=Profundibacter sp. TaxID=3101071 RepID=UPI003D0C3FA2